MIRSAVLASLFLSGCVFGSETPAGSQSNNETNGTNGASNGTSNGASNNGGSNSGASNNGGSNNGPECGGFFTIDPRSTFLRAAADDSTEAPVIVDLVAVGLPPESQFDIVTNGAWLNARGDLGRERRQANLVFSSSDEYGPDTERDRVPGAITTDDGEPVNVLGMEAELGMEEDRLVAASSSRFEVPQGAKFLFLGVFDTRYADNNDEDGDFGVALTCL